MGRGLEVTGLDTASPAAPTGAAEAPRRNGRYDAMQRRRAQRRGREKGCWVYIAAEELAKTGFVPGGDLPWYRVWGSPRGGLTCRLYGRG